jgi:hypothetical protein
MNTTKWGNPLWIFLHCTALNYPLNPTPKDKIKSLYFITSLQDMLPCKYCRESYKIYVKYLPIDKYLDSRNGVCYWLYTLHNLVNDKICKPKVTFKYAMDKYEPMRAGCGKVKLKKKSFGSCQKKVNNTDVNGFVKETEMKYKKMTDLYLDIFNKSKDNPNKIKSKRYYVLRKKEDIDTRKKIEI